MAGERVIKIKVDGQDNTGAMVPGLSRKLDGLDSAARRSAGGMGAATDATDKHARSTQKTTSANDGLRNSFSAGSIAALGFGVAIGAWLSSTAAVLINMERLSAQTTAAINSMNASWTNTDAVVAYAEQIEKMSGIEMESVQSGQNLLLTYGNIRNELGSGNDIFNQATSLMTDLSVATGKDMPAAATLLGKALNNPIAGLSALQKVGVAFTDQQKEQIKTLVESGNVMGAQKIILAELTKEFGGSAKAFGETTAGQVAKLTNTFGDLSEELLADVLPAINDVVEFLADAAHWLQDNAGLVQTLAVVLGGLVATYLAVHAAIKLVNAATLAFHAVASLVQGSTAGLGAGFANLSRGAKVASLSMGAIGLIATLIGTALSIFGGQSAAASAKQEALAAASKDVAKVLQEQNNALNEKTRAAAAAALEEGDLLEVTERLGLSTSDLTDAYLGDNDARTRLNQAIQGHIDALNKEGQARLDAGDVEGAARLDPELNAYKNLKTNIDNAIGGRQGESEAIDRQREATEESTGATDNSTEALQRNIDAINELIDAQREAAGVVLSERDAQREFVESIAAADEARQKNGVTLDINTQAGRDNQAALDGIVTKTFDVIDAMNQNNASSGQLSEAMTNGRAAFINTAIAMGLTEQQAKDLADQLGLIPTSVKTRAELDAAVALDAVIRYKNYLDNLPASVNTILSTGITGQGGHMFRATGGPVHAGKSYVVGERGPEVLVMPNSSGGTMVPNHQLGGGNTTVYVTIDGEQIQGRIDRTVRENDRRTKRSATAGTGRR